MIEHLKINRLRRETRFKHCDIRDMDFKTGINLILGANGSGKSSIISCLHSFVGLRNDFGRERQDVDFLENIQQRLVDVYNVEVTGKVCKTLCYKPQELRESFDLNFMQSDIRTAISSRFQSVGEGRVSYHQFFSNYVSENYQFSSDDYIALKKLPQMIDYAHLLITADEPENSMAINMQFGLFDWFCEFAEAWGERLQLVIATHSVAAFKLAEKNLPYVNVIELNKGWVKKINKRIME